MFYLGTSKIDKVLRILVIMNTNMEFGEVKGVVFIEVSSLRKS